MTDTRIGVDVGGTFTDVTLLVDDDLITAKVPTTNDQSVGVIEGVHKACATAGIEPAAVDAFSHAMTVSVNALLERDGADTALVTTAGFRDVLEIGRQARPSLYDLDAEKPPTLVPRRRRFEIDERATPAGIESAVDDDAVRELAAEIDATDAESVAVCLLHAYASPENERRVAAILRETLDVPVSASHEVLPEFREFERTATTAAEAYVTPGIDGYLGRLLDESRETGLPDPRIMKSNGGVADVDTVRENAVTTVLSGPAAGVVGAAASVEGDGIASVEGDGIETEANDDTAAAEGVVTFDMGGTSSDVSLVRDGSAARTAETEIDGIPVRTPMVDVDTVGAGGGSIAWTDAGGALRVGPESAGADPGPACYGNGGTRPTVTDANVVLGYIGPDAALGGELSLDVDAAHDALDRLAEAAGLADATAAARGVYRVANATMTRAIRSVTVERGHDPRRFGLVAFGGAGPMHAAALAESLGVSRVIVPGPAGVLSAYGLLAADESHDAVRTVRLPLDGDRPSRDVAAAGDEVYDELVDRVLEDASAPEAARVERAADCRYVGQSFELTVPVDGFDPKTVAARFQDAHERAYGYRLDAPVEAVNLRVSATVDVDSPTVTHTGGSGDATVGARTATFPGAGAVETTVYDRDGLAVGERIEGPAVLEQAESTTVVPPSWAGSIRRNGALVLDRAASDGGVDDVARGTEAGR
ncbi:hydantoinase/oxoprolinase family protein [Halorubrum sp. JWXQ-INN 858]|uniref:hydantoinase/oxoprolinase family protein n=1 Tax=Halorubrum sp. JWXQ-INN 858 TaxID=2690782 RepID=UPI001358059F|nr:hydantoinase/oxoprolinase family protein [Halorubrum sp. JWXQ-INN 858]MWV66053.1 hydantoinase/oxoprolinase family protein [Halorubrum sp. JWXQ-INN 858]